jgi:hypothetical protein
LTLAFLVLTPGSALARRFISQRHCQEKQQIAGEVRSRGRESGNETTARGRRISPRRR